MKKVLLGILVLIVLAIGGGVYFIFSNLDTLVEHGIETAGSSAAGSQVQVESVDLDLLGGRATVRGFTLDNPPGYSDAPMLSFDELAVILDISGMSRDSNTIRILSVTAHNPHLLYETRDGISNLDVTREFLAAGRPAPEGPGPTINLEIGSIVIDGIGATVSSELLPQPAEVDLGDIRLENLSGTPNEIAQEVLRPLLTQLALNAGRIALTLVPEDLRTAGAAARDAASAGLEQVGEAVGGATQELREGLGNLLNRNDDESDEADADDNTGAVTE